jgi:hypothetical protein
LLARALSLGWRDADLVTHDVGEHWDFLERTGGEWPDRRDGAPAELLDSRFSLSSSPGSEKYGKDRGRAAIGDTCGLSAAWLKSCKGLGIKNLSLFWSLSELGSGLEAFAQKPAAALPCAGTESSKLVSSW